MRDLLSEFIQCLHVAKESLATDIGLEPGVEEIADMLWLAQQIQQPISNADDEVQSYEAIKPSTTRSSEIEDVSNIPNAEQEISNPPPQVRSVGILTPYPDLSSQETAASTEPNISQQTATASVEGKPVMIPAAAALRHPLKLARSLRPLIRKTESRTRFEIDEEATAIALAENNPVRVIQQPVQEKWLELELVIEESKAALIWDAIAKEFIELMEQLGAFRTLRVWRLDTLLDENGQPIPRLMAGRKSTSHPINTTRLGKPKELINPTGQQLVILLSDCISPLWRQGLIHEWLAEWGSHGPTVIFQWFPESYWSRTALKAGSKVWLSALSPGVSNDRMARHYGAINPDNWSQLRQSLNLSKTIAIPVVTIEPSSLNLWARVVAGYGNAQVQGRRFKLIWQEGHWRGPAKSARPLPDLDEERFWLFLETASGIAKQLAGLMSLGPVSPEITHLIQEKLLPQSGAVHVAEVFLSGLLERTTDDCYRFVPGVQEKLQKLMLKVDEKLVFRVLSEYVSERYGRTPREFRAFLQRHHEWTEDKWGEAFATSGFAELWQRLPADISEEDVSPHEPLENEVAPDDLAASDSWINDISSEELIGDRALSTQPQDSSDEITQFLYKDIPPLLPYLPGRTDQEYELGKAVQRLQTSTPRLPLVCIVHGDELQSHDQYLERLREVSLPRLLSPQSPISIKTYLLQWPQRSRSSKTLSDRLCVNLAKSVTNYVSTDIEQINDTLRQYPYPVVIHMHLFPEDWQQFGSPLLPEILAFWQQWPNLAPDQILIVTIFIKYRSNRPRSKPGWSNPLGSLRRAMKQRQVISLTRKIRQELNVLAYTDANRFDRIICVVLPELSNVSIRDLEAWVRGTAITYVGESNSIRLLEGIRDMFEAWERETNTTTMPMENAASQLIKLLQQYSEPRKLARKVSSEQPNFIPVSAEQSNQISAEQSNPGKYITSGRVIIQSMRPLETGHQSVDSPRRHEDGAND